MHATTASNPVTHATKVLIAFRGNPDFGQNPAEVPFGMPPDHLMVVRNVADASRHASACIVEADAGGGNWAGGDVWFGHTHIGRVAYNGKFFKDQKGPLVTSGEYGATGSRASGRDDGGTFHALRDLLNQLEAVGIYMPGQNEGQWAGTEGLSFEAAERAALTSAQA